MPKHGLTEHQKVMCSKELELLSTRNRQSTSFVLFSVPSERLCIFASRCSNHRKTGPSWTHFGDRLIPDWVRFWVRLWQIVADCIRMAQFGSDCGRLRRLGQTGSEWVRLHQIEADWLRLCQFGQDCVRFHQIGSNWIRLYWIVADCVRLYQIGQVGADCG